MHNGSAPAGYIFQCIRRHYVFIGTLMTYSFAALIDNHFGTFATMRTVLLRLAEGRGLDTFQVARDLYS